MNKAVLIDKVLEISKKIVFKENLTIQNQFQANEVFMIEHYKAG